MSYINFLSFARGIQNGYNSNNYPILSVVEADKEYKKVLHRFCSAYSIEQDILKQFSDGGLDQWEAVEQLEDELGYSYDEACRKVGSIIVSSYSDKDIPDIDGHANAYWISPDGRILPVKTSHIDCVFDEPASFGLTMKEVKSIYDKYREAYRIEGQARNDLIEGLIKKGWIRIRYIITEDVYHIEVNNLTNKSKDSLWWWSLALIKSNEKRTYSGVLLCKFGDRYASITGTIQELSKFQLFSSAGCGFNILIPIKSVYEFLSIAPYAKAHNLYSAGKRRKRSKYNGALVNNTFDESTGAISTVVPASPVSISANIRYHPSVRYLVVNHLLHPTRRHLIKCSLSGEIDTFLLQNYCSGLGHTNIKENLKHMGKNGRVVLKFDSDSGHSTEVDLGCNLGTGYVVTSINDELGLFPENTVVGDLIINDIIQEILRSQGERDRGDVISGFIKSEADVSTENTINQLMDDFFEGYLKYLDVISGALYNLTYPLLVSSYSELYKKFKLDYIKANKNRAQAMFSLKMALSIQEKSSNKSLDFSKTEDFILRFRAFFELMLGWRDDLGNSLHDPDVDQALSEVNEELQDMQSDAILLRDGLNMLSREENKYDKDLDPIISFVLNS